MSDDEGFIPPRAGFADRMIREVYEVTNSFIIADATALTAERDGDIRIAVLGSGIPNQSKFILGDSRRIKDRKSFTGEPDTADYIGFGTVVTQLLLDLAPTADVYCAKVTDERRLPEHSILNVAKAIEHSVRVWNVDIIACPYGWISKINNFNTNSEASDAVKRAKNAIEEASKAGTIIFAPCSDGRIQKSPLYPANDDRVICINACDGNGVRWIKNTNPIPNADNFTTLGVDIRSFWRLKEVYKSGADYAVAVAAAFAANVLHIANERCTLSEAQRKLLYRKEGMVRVFREMSVKQTDGYDFVHLKFLNDGHKIPEVLCPTDESPGPEIVSASPDMLQDDDAGERRKIDPLAATETDEWMKKSEAFRQIISRTSKEPIRVAILDTGVDLPEDVMNTAVYDADRIRCYNCIDLPSVVPYVPGSGSDRDGHGTHITSIILDLARACNVYCFQISRKRTDVKTQEVAENMTKVRRLVVYLTRSTSLILSTKAIYYAIRELRVDIICIASGFDSDCGLTDLIRAVAHANLEHVLVIAAAGNKGDTQEVSYPASAPTVLGAFSTTGYGNKYGGNPNPANNEFAFLGYAVEGYRRAEESAAGEMVRRSGTSQATAIATGIAAVIMQLLREFEDVEHFYRVPPYKELAEKLRTIAGMNKVLRRMTGAEMGLRDGYRVVKPWKLVSLDDYEGHYNEVLTRKLVMENVVRRIKDALLFS